MSASARWSILPSVSRLPGERVSWLVQRRGEVPRTVHRVGPEKLGTHLLMDAEAVRTNPSHLQKGLAGAASRQHLAWLLRKLGIDCVLDVGANVGQFARSLRHNGYTGRIVSFEPVARLAADLQVKAADDPAWQVWTCALGDEDGEAEINTRQGSMSSMLPSSEFGRSWHHRLRESEKETIRIRRLDQVFDEAVAGLTDPRVYLKMDTQGYDLRTFHGAGERINEIVGMQSEVSCVPIYDGMPRMVEQVDAYERAGFAMSGMFPVSYDKRTARVIEFDVVMVRPEAAA